MSENHPFFSRRAQGFVRVGACTPIATAGDPQQNAEAAIALARDADASGIDLLVYPELNISSYAIDDLHLQGGYLAEVEIAIRRICEETAALAPVMLMGAALRHTGRLYNCAIAIHRGRILGAVPKTFLPNYREFYEKRWFAPGAGLTGLTMRAAGQEFPFGTDLLFAADDMEDFVIHAEICEDFWAPTQPSTMGALAGATVLCNLSASNIVIGKSRDRKALCAAQAVRTISAYVFSAAGPGESTNDMAWDGQGLIYELGDLLAESARFEWQAETVHADVDVARVRQERLRVPTFNDAAVQAGHPETRFRRIGFSLGEADATRDDLHRPVRRFPFVPNNPAKLDEDCYEAFNIQVEGLAKRLRATGAKTLVIGISGGLDSTHALIVAAKAMDKLGRPRTDIHGFTMPGFATGDSTKSNAWALMRAVGITAEEIDIRPAAQQMLSDMDHPFAGGEPVYDTAFENVQAGLRTDYLFRLAGQRGGFVLGTGDLSELALGWCTYGVGDQMSHYGVNSGVPKTLIQYLIRWAARTDQLEPEADRILEAILDTEISPELVPVGEDGRMQSTEDRIGPYALHDFFLFWTLRYGLSPSKIAFRAWHAWRDVESGLWPIAFPEEGRPQYDLPTVAKWLRVFLERYFGFAQFKRTAMPNGPKISHGGSLSPRGDWRAPSDGTARPWLDELDRALPEAFRR